MVLTEENFIEPEVVEVFNEVEVSVHSSCRVGTAGMER